MKKIRNGWVVCLIFTIALSACGGAGGGSSQSSDTLTIVGINPASAVAGASTTFAVDVSYTLASKNSGMLMIGFNTTAVGSYSMLGSPQPTVVKGSGTYTFNVTATPVDWGSTGSFQAYVNLSENPHPATWVPLAGEVKAIPSSTLVSSPVNFVTQAFDLTQLKPLVQCMDITCF